MFPVKQWTPGKCFGLNIIGAQYKK